MAKIETQAGGFVRRVMVGSANRIDDDTLLAIRRALDTNPPRGKPGHRAHRAIGGDFGVGGKTVDRIAKGHLGPRGANRAAGPAPGESHLVDVYRCGGCGKRVTFHPCVVCRALGQLSR